MRKLLIVLSVVLGIVFILGISACSTYNGLINKQQAVDSSWAQVQTVYQRRADLIPNLVQAVSGAANFEKSTLTAVTDARASVGKVTIDANNAPAEAAKLEEYQRAQGQLTSALSHLLSIVENYPNLKSNQSFLEFQAQLEGTENRISVERGRFNAAVQDYNASIKRFPGVLFAGPMGFSAKPYFTATTEAQSAPAVHFDFGTPPAK